MPKKNTTAGGKRGGYSGSKAAGTIKVPKSQGATVTPKPEK